MENLFYKNVFYFRPRLVIQPCQLRSAARPTELFAFLEMDINKITV